MAKNRNERAKELNTEVNKEMIVVGPVETGYSHIVKPSRNFENTKDEFNVEFQLDPSTAEGKSIIASITEAHKSNVEFVLKENPGVKDIQDYGVPIKLIDSEELNTKGKKKNSPNFKTGNFKVRAKSLFEPGLFGSVKSGDGGNSDLRLTPFRYIPAGSKVKVKLTLISFLMAGDKARGIPPYAGSSVKVQSVKVLSVPAKTPDFDSDSSAELLNLGFSSESTFSEDTGIL